MSNATQDTWETKEESASGLFLKIQPDSEVRIRFVGNPIKRMESYGDEPLRPRWYCRVIVHAKDGSGKAVSEAKVFGFGVMIKNAIADFRLSDDWGDPGDFDVIIKRTGADKGTKYSLIPCPKKPLPDALKAKAMEIDLEKVTSQDSHGTSEDGQGYDPFV